VCRLRQLPLALQIALGVMLTGWMGLGLLFLSLVPGGFASFWHAAVWLSYFSLLLAVALLGMGISWAMETLMSLNLPLTEGVAERTMEIVRHRPRFWLCLHIGMGAILGVLGLWVILSWSLFLPMIIECRVFQECTPSVLD
jgi:hypothetical protein